MKLECVGHIQKRLGTRLRNTVNEYKGTKKTLSGKGKLLEKHINSMQTFYGIAIRQNNELVPMKKAIGAILWHCTDFKQHKENEEETEDEKEERRHQFCPHDSFTWCKYQKYKLTGKQKYKSKINIPKWIHNIIKPIFEDLPSSELLSKCLHGKTQNTNEALNNIIWIKCPKSVFVTKSVLEMGVNSAIMEFNDGACGINKVYKMFGIITGI